MKEPYIWNYNIKVKTKDGEYEYERETLENIENLLAQHQDYTEVRATHVKKLVKERGHDTKRSTGATTKTRQ